MWRHEEILKARETYYFWVETDASGQNHIYPSTIGSPLSSQQKADRWIAMFDSLERCGWNWGVHWHSGHQQDNWPADWYYSKLSLPLQAEEAITKSCRAVARC